MGVTVAIVTGEKNYTGEKRKKTIQVVRGQISRLVCYAKLEHNLLLDKLLDNYY